MVLIDSYARWFNVYWLSTRNAAFTKLLARVINLWAQFPITQSREFLLINAGEFKSQTFNGYCISIEIVIEHSVTQFIHKMVYCSRLSNVYNLLLGHYFWQTKHPASFYSHAILHAVSLVCIKLIVYYLYSPLQLY